MSPNGSAASGGGAALAPPQPVGPAPADVVFAILALGSVAIAVAALLSTYRHYRLVMRVLAAVERSVHYARRGLLTVLVGGTIAGGGWLFSQQSGTTQALAVRVLALVGLAYVGLVAIGIAVTPVLRRWRSFHARYADTARDAATDVEGGEQL